MDARIVKAVRGKETPASEALFKLVVSGWTDIESQVTDEYRRKKCAQRVKDASKEHHLLLRR